MSALTRKNLDTPEEVRKFEAGTGQLDLVNLDAGPVGRATFLPGWRWSDHVKPIAQADSCESAHSCYFIAGRMKVVSDDGQEMEYGPGDFAVMAPGHDAWIIGDEPCIGKASPTTRNHPGRRHCALAACRTVTRRMDRRSG